ncbi:MAG: saccharopine dehydrogenase NADP-binding domain-containing protein, partial [Bacteroidota bacterium]|nr:saccharopine dehydrogenase NADP-binding domain-containing protein [Bacteroidota bacterium]
MEKLSVLIIGGYGIVGMEAVKILSALPQFKIFVAGRNVEKAQKVATTYNCDWKYIDVDERASIEVALKDIDIVLNCFISMDKVNVSVAEIVATTGKKYIDVAGLPLEHQYKIKELHEKAKSTGALLITAFGVNPGIAGILLKYHADLLVEVDKTEILFTMGANFDEISLLSLIGIGDLMLIPPKIWKNNELIAPDKSSKKEFIGEPFNKKMYFSSGVITPDISAMEVMHKIKTVEFWSAIERFWISIVLYFSIKRGKTKTKEKASLLLKRLKRIGSKKKYHTETNITVKSFAIKDGKKSTIETSFYCTEVFATALAPSIACSLIYEGGINTTGAFYATEVVNSKDFVSKLKDSNIHFNEIF